MKKWRNILSICLVLQLFLVVAVNLGQTDYATFKPRESLLDFDRKTVDAVHIEQTEVKPLDLKKENGKWRVVSLDNFQADQKKVDEFLGSLAEVKKGWPVVTTAAAARRFKVAEDDFGHKVMLAAAGKDLGTLFVGTSPSFRKVHVRKKSQDSVYLAKIDSYSLDAEPENWIDKGIFKHDPSSINRVVMPNFALTRRDKKWVVEGMNPEKEETVEEEVEHLLDQISQITISSVLTGKGADQYKNARKVLVYSLELSSGKTETYVFSKPAQDNQDYLLAPSHKDKYFSVKHWVVDNIKKIDRSKILRKKDADNKAKKDALP